MEPGVEPVRIAQRGQLPPCADERFLDRVLRQIGVPKDQASDRVEAITGGGREDFKSLVIAASGRLDEIAPHARSITCTNRSGVHCLL